MVAFVHPPFKMFLRGLQSNTDTLLVLSSSLSFNNLRIFSPASCNCLNTQAACNDIIFWKQENSNTLGVVKSILTHPSIAYFTFASTFSLFPSSCEILEKCAFHGNLQDQLLRMQSEMDLKQSVLQSVNNKFLIFLVLKPASATANLNSIYKSLCHKSLKRITSILFWMPSRLSIVLADIFFWIEDSGAFLSLQSQASVSLSSEIIIINKIAGYIIYIYLYYINLRPHNQQVKYLSIRLKSEQFCFCDDDSLQQLRNSDC